MGTTFANDLYYGRIAPWERQRTRRARQADLNSRLEQEKVYLTKSMSQKERSHWEEYEKLSGELSEQEKLEAFKQGLRIGAFFMETICRDYEERGFWY